MNWIKRLTRREPADDSRLIGQVRELTHPLRGPEDLDPLLEALGDARYVLLGGASHGTAEDYTWRTAISSRLITEKGFSFIAVEGGWSDCYYVNRYVKGRDEAAESAREVLHVFERWPTWLWANAELVELVEWLRQHNDGRPEEQKVGFYGLDVYSLWDSLYTVMDYLHRVDPGALPAVWRAFRCFEPYGEDVQGDDRATRFVPNSCENEAVPLLQELRSKVRDFPADGPETHFAVEQNALVLKNAEAYYRAMVRGGPDSWNLRDRHMTETLERLIQHHGPQAKAIVWAHNSHIGDARHTDMAERGEINVGQLIRERHSDEGVALVGFGSYQGSVIAGRQWKAPMERMQVPPAREGSWEEILHRAGTDDRLLLLADARRKPELMEPRGHRAIGVIYRPKLEPQGQYVPTVLPGRYDAFIYLDTTQALHPLPEVEPRVGSEGEGKRDVPETYPSGL